MPRLSHGAALILFVCVSLFGIADASEPGWIADPRTGCKVWDASLKPNETIEWSGGCRGDGRATGEGILQAFGDGKPSDRYEGTLQGGKKSGQGIYHFVNGDRYEGEWRDDKANGEGTFYYEDGQFISGDWIKGCLSEDELKAAVGATREECGFE